MQGVADEILEKIRLRVGLEEPETMNPQSLRHLTGVLKDLKDIQMLRSEQDRQEQAAKIRNLRRQGAPETATVTVSMTEELEEYCE